MEDNVQEFLRTFFGGDRQYVDVAARQYTEVPTVEDWRQIKLAERRQEEMTLDEQIDELTERLADLQRKKRLRDELKELYDLPFGGVVQFAQKFPRSETVYNYAAVKVVDETGEHWQITGSSKSAPHGQGTDKLVAWHDHAIEVVILVPYVKTLRQVRLEGDSDNLA